MIESQLSPQLVQQARAGGHWHNKTLLDFLDEVAPSRLDKVAVTDLNSMTGQANTLSYRQLLRLSKRIALGLAALGVQRGDVVSYQLPNWWQFVALHLACLRIGAVTNPVMPIFRHHELTFMLGLAESKVMIVPREFRGFDHAAMLREIQPALPQLKHIFAIGGEGDMSFEKHFIERRWEQETPDADQVLAERRLRPDEVMQLLYTSGTTGEPKGALHTSNTHFANIVEVVKRCGLTAEHVCFMPSPMAHQTGFAIGMELPLMLGAKMVLQDIWEPELALTRIQDEGVNFMMAATPFLADLTDHPDLPRYDISTLDVFISAGAPIPRTLVERATERLKAHIVSAWGMTENILVTGTRLDDVPEKVFGTDGVPVPGMEIRVVDAAGQALAVDQEGELQSRGPSHFVGYLKRPERYDMDDQGWFKTGDLARIDADGCVRITGRAKDIIIRGGENVPVVEVEQMLHRHLAIQTAAVVGVPDARLGERAVAYVTLRPGHGLTFEQMKRFLEEQRMTKQYWPETLIVLDDLPRTPTGKIQKFRLREMARAENKTD
ncbi:cyclohexanecarboxylate-CoA ligase [Polaromonas sp. JS666]|uniref:cyclohexanecarboxylate-CoA ligase n=1 Tax=Polaromonas sp. (strain JS666 / ATCC BAA-500) TaxID=296591 RepID=UPI00004646E8|nr:cyclohexanecarboxylate-CoA ligase [Polaromonas sp. JS666]ABE47115.1 AMP-dependent synthetase and ligase [Polaromonas sp. JS666]